jgi:hypothetical protein
VAPSLSGSWAATWPLLLALALVVAARATGRPGLRLPEGDVVVWAERTATQRERSPPHPARRAHLGPSAPGPGLGRVVAAAEAGMRELPAVGLAMLLVGVVLWFVLWAAERAFAGSMWHRCRSSSSVRGRCASA